MNILCILISPLFSLLSKEASGVVVFAFCYEARENWYNLTVVNGYHPCGHIAEFFPLF